MRDNNLHNTTQNKLKKQLGKNYWPIVYSQCAIYYPHPYTKIFILHIDCKHENLGANDNDLIKTDSK